jgi:AcrR family transcriptional regulator
VYTGPVASALNPVEQTVNGYRHGRVPRALREEQLLDVAEEVFGEFGYQGGSIEEITRRAGVKRPLIYTYFGGKDGLYIACYRRAREEFDQRLASALSGLAPDQDDDVVLALIERGARVYFEFLFERPQRWQILYGSGAAQTGPAAEEVISLRFRTVDTIAGLIAQTSPRTDTRTCQAFAHAVSGAGEQLARWWRRTPEIELDELVDWQTRFIWHGIAQLREEENPAG